MIHHNFDQGTPEWLQCRAGKITASRCKDARNRLADKPEKTDKKTGEVTPAQRGAPSAKQTAYAAQVAVERIAGCPIDGSFENWQMREGHVQEPLARIAYETQTGNLVEEVGALATDDDLFLYSPDGLVGDDGLIEIKSLFSADCICNIVGGDDISDFIDQCMFGLWLTGRQWVDLVIWAPALANIGLNMTIIRIDRDEAAIEGMECDLITFAAMVSEIECRLRAKAAAQATAAALAQAATPDPLPAPKVQTVIEVEVIQAEATFLNGSLPVTTAPDPVPNLAPAPQDTGATMRLGQICERLGFTVTADFLSTLGFEYCATDKNAKLYKARAFPLICKTLVQHIQGVCEAAPA